MISPAAWSHVLSAAITKVTAKFQELVKVDKLPQKATLHKPAKWLGFEEYTGLSKHWLFLPFEDSQPDETKLLDSVDLEVGALEILWRVLPPYTVMLPVQLPSCLHQGSVTGREAAQEAAVKVRSGLVGWQDKANTDRFWIK